ncbi:MAG: GNAT family N-acetyltransferase [Patescibacteria group bacterium]
MLRLEDEKRMIGTEEMGKTNTRVEVTTASQIRPEDSDEAMRLFKIGYAERWQGEENYKNNIINNATELLRLYEDDSLAASITLDNGRITCIAVHPDFRGQGLGKKLFEEAAKVNPDVWIGVTVNATGMMATLTTEGLNYLPIDNKDKIENLYRMTNQGHNSRVMTQSMEIPFLSERLKEKGIDKNTFTAYTREGGTHGLDYRQVLFQNQSLPKPS